MADREHILETWPKFIFLSALRGEEMMVNAEDGEGSRRIFVGGLGASVTPDDLERTFSSLGRIHGLDIIRTNGRNFAYMDFQPVSDKALTKLFSLYNGCIWKGGRLRLEKAKEHYLARLHREWDTDAAQLVTDVVDADSLLKVQERTSLTPEKSGLKIFFPRQNKVKVLPSKGTGKHKYSFQRVESVPVSQLPLCGCEEHIMHLERDGNNETDVDMGNAMTDTGGVSEKELNIMKTVIERLTGNEEQMQTAMEVSNKTEVGHAYKYAKWARGKPRLDMERFDDKDDTEWVNNDEDAFKSSDLLRASMKVKEDSIEKELENIKAFEDDRDPVLQDSGDKKSLSRGNTGKIARKNAREQTSTKAKFHVSKLGENNFKREILRGIFHENTNSSPMEGNGGEPGVVELKESKRLKVEDGVCSSIQHKEARENFNIDVGLEMKSSTSPKGHGNGTVAEVQDSSRSWVQKASWRDLVGQTGRVSFSLSSIMGAAGSSPLLVKDKESKILGSLENSPNHAGKETKKEHLDSSSKNVMQKGLRSSNDEGSHSFLRGLVVKPENLESQKSEPIAAMDNVDDTIKGQEVPKHNFAEMKVEDKKNHVQVDNDLQLSGQDTGSPAVCTFIRSENAEAEWLKSKAAVQRYAKAHRKMALKSTKGLGMASAGRF